MKQFKLVCGTFAALLLGLALWALPSLAEDELSGGQWQLISIDGQPAAVNSLITLTFDNEGSLFGSSGCNSYSATYTVEGDRISIGPIISTLMMCTNAATAEQERAYIGALQNAVTWTVVDGQLLLMTRDGVELNFARRAALEGTQWLLVSINETPALPDSAVTLIFGEDGTLGGSAGCNRYTGGYDARGDAFSTAALIRTERLCADEALNAQEEAYLSALSRAFAYTKTADELVITTPEGGIVFMAVPRLDGTEWTLTAIGDTPTAADSQLTIRFDEEGRVSGETGCNRFMGSYRLNELSLTISQLASTRRACPSAALSQQEQAYLRALESVESYRAGRGQLVLITDSGQTLTFSAAVTLENTEWKLIRLNGAEVAAENRPTLIFGTNGQLSGSGGCNRYGGGFTREDQTLRVGPIFSTMMACSQPIMTQENAFLAALEAAATLRLANNQLILSGDGVELVFEP